VLANHDCPGHDVFVLGVAFDSVVEGDGVHDVQQLTFVLVDTFHLKKFISIIKYFSQSKSKEWLTLEGKTSE